MVKKYFKSDSLVKIIKQLNNLKNQNNLVARDAKILSINIGLSDLKEDMKKLSESQVKNRELDLLANFIENLLTADQINSMLPLESEEDAAKRQRGQGLKITTPSQLITRLPILLAQIKKAGNNSQKLKNEIRQIAYSLYGSNNLSKLIYNNLINTI